MRAMLLEAAGRPLKQVEIEAPRPGPGQVRLKVEACAVCRTDLHILDGELSQPKLPLILGHQIVGTVDMVGSMDLPVTPGFAVAAPALGDRVGIPWLGWTCGCCRHCRSGHENLCDCAKFTGYDIDGGYAEYAVADRRYAFPIPADYPSVQAAPLLCAGLIGYRSLVMTCSGERLGIYGFGSAAHIVTQVARHQGRRVFAFTRPGDSTAQDFAREVGAEWAGDTLQQPPEELDAAIIFAPAGELVPIALRAIAKGGVVVCGGIHMSDIPSFPYDILWGERMVRSVANLTRQDGHEFLALAPRVPVHTEVVEFALEEANEALERLRRGEMRGAAVLVIDRSSSRSGLRTQEKE